MNTSYRKIPAFNRIRIQFTMGKLREGMVSRKGIMQPFFRQDQAVNIKKIRNNVAEPVCL
jgi:hypothetical protein